MVVRLGPGLTFSFLPLHTLLKESRLEATKSQAQEVTDKVAPIYSVGTPCYTLYCDLRHEKDARWVPAVVTKVFGTHSVNVRVCPRVARGEDT